MRVPTTLSIALIALVILMSVPAVHAQVQDDGEALPTPDPPAPAAPVGPFDASLTTLFASNNGFAGNMFDLTANTPITIVGFDVNVQFPGSTNTVEVYYRMGTSVGAEGSAAGWTLMGTDTMVTSAGTDSPSPVNVGGLTLVPGQVYGIYVNLVSYAQGVSRMVYTNGGPTLYSNADLDLTTHVGKGTPAFTGGTFTPREWNGTVYYTFAAAPALPWPATLALVLILLAVGTVALRRFAT